MASKKKKAAKAGAGAFAAGKAVRDNPYVQRLAEDEELRENLRTAFESSKKVYARMSNGKGPVKALDDKKTQKQLKEAAESLRDAANALRGAKSSGKRKRRRGGLLLLLVGAGLALALSESLRSKVLDALFGSEEEFEYSSTTTTDGSASSAAPVGSTS
jgi:adenylosuccinate synthase